MRIAEFHFRLILLVSEETIFVKNLIPNRISITLGLAVSTKYECRARYFIKIGLYQAVYELAVISPQSRFHDTEGLVVILTFVIKRKY